MKNYKQIDLFGKKAQLIYASCDIFFNPKKYTYENRFDALENKEAVICNFVEDDERIIYIEIYHLANPDDKTYHRLHWQDPRFGLDVLDDREMCDIANNLLKTHEEKKD